MAKEEKPPILKDKEPEAANYQNDTKFIEASLQKIEARRSPTRYIPKPPEKTQTKKTPQYFDHSPRCRKRT